MTHGRAERWRIARVTAVGLVALLVAGCAQSADDGASEGEDAAGGSGGEAATEELEEVTITWPGGVGPDHWSAQGVQAWAEEIESRSDGKITFDFHWAGALGPLPDHATMLEDGLSDISEIYMPFDSSFEVADWIASLGWYQEARPLLGDLQAYGASVEWGFTDVARQELEDRGLVPLIPNIQIIANHSMICREPVTSLDEAQGLSVRVPGPVVGEEAEAVGLSPTQIPGPETYEALQRGTIDCSIAHPRDMTAYSLDEVAPHLTVGSETDFSGFMGQGVYTSRAFWDGLQDEAKQIIHEAIPAYVEAHLEAALAEDLTAFNQAETVNAPEPELAGALASHQESVLESMSESAPAMVEDPEGAVQEFTDIHDAWEAELEDAYPDWPDAWEEHITAYEEEPADLSAWLELFEQRVLEPNAP